MTIMSLCLLPCANGSPLIRHPIISSFERPFRFCFRHNAFSLQSGPIDPRDGNITLETERGRRMTQKETTVTSTRWNATRRILRETASFRWLSLTLFLCPYPRPSVPQRRVHPCHVDYIGNKLILSFSFIFFLTYGPFLIHSRIWIQGPPCQVFTRSKGTKQGTEYRVNRTGRKVNGSQ